MRNFIFIIFFLMICRYGNSQIPESIINISAGVGQPYGRIGVKTIIGINSSGLVLGIGSFGDGVTGHTIGGQLAIMSFYLNLNYGTIRTIKINNGPVEAINAISFLAGYMFDLGYKRRFYMDLAIGHSFGAPSTNINGSTYSNDSFCFNIGIGYRIPMKRNKRDNFIESNQSSNVLQD